MGRKARAPEHRPAPAAARVPRGFARRRVDVDGVTLSYTTGGQGPVVVLLHGNAQTSHMWNPLLPVLGTSHTVIAPDLRGAGGSARPAGGPLLVLTGEKASGTFLIEQARLVATNVAGTVVKGSGHWLMEEARDQVIPVIASFLG